MTRYTTYATALWLMLTALLLPTSCLIDDSLDDNGAASPPSATVPGVSTPGDGQSAPRDRVTLRIVGSTPTRASDVEENAIYDGILVVYDGNTDQAKQVSAVVIDQKIENTVGGVVIEQRLTGITDYSNDYYLLVLLNTSSSQLRVANGELVNGAGTKLEKLSEVKDYLLPSVGNDEERHVGLFMSNDEQTDGNRLVKATFDPDNPVTVKVERAAARVVVTHAETNPTISLYRNSDTDKKTKFTLYDLHWTIDNYYTQGYAISGGSGSTPVIHSDLPNFTLYPTQGYEKDKRIYIAENSSSDKNTSVVLAVRLTEGSFLLNHFYSYEGISDRIFTTAEEAKKYVGSSYDEKNLKEYTDGLMFYRYYVSSDDEHNIKRNTSYTLTLSSLPGLGSNAAGSTVAK